MSWVNQDTQSKFTVLVNQLVAFHDRFGKEKNQLEFNAIKEACVAALDLLYAETKPDNADVMMASISGVIQTNINGIVLKKQGQAQAQSFVSAYGAVMLDLSRFNEAYKVTLGEKHPVGRLKPQERKSLTLIFDKDTLLTQMDSLGQVPVVDRSWASFFKRTWNHAWSHHPKKMVGSVLTGTTGLSYLGLTLLNDYLSETFHECENENHVLQMSRYVFAGTLLLAGVTVSGIAFSKSLPARPRVQPIYDLEEVQSAEDAPLLKEMSERPSRFGCF